MVLNPHNRSYSDEEDLRNQEPKNISSLVIPHYKLFHPLSIYLKAQLNPCLTFTR